VSLRVGYPLRDPARVEPEVEDVAAARPAVSGSDEDDRSGEQDEERCRNDGDRAGDVAGDRIRRGRRDLGADAAGR